MTIRIVGNAEKHGGRVSAIDSLDGNLHTSCSTSSMRHIQVLNIRENLVGDSPKKFATSLFL